MANFLENVKKGLDTVTSTVTTNPIVDSVKHGIGSATEVVSRGITSLSRDIAHTIDSRRSSPMLEMFKGGNVIMLVSQSSGRALQTVRTSSGKMTVDGAGDTSDDNTNAHWTVINEGNNVVRLLNSDYYLAILSGSTCLLTTNNPSDIGPETKFRLSLRQDGVTLESFVMDGQHVAVTPEGEMKSASDATKDFDAQFTVKLISGNAQ